MLKWVLILTLRIYHGPDQTSTFEDKFPTYEKCKKKGIEISKKYNGAMTFKCEWGKNG